MSVFLGLLEIALGIGTFAGLIYCLVNWTETVSRNKYLAAQARGYSRVIDGELWTTVDATKICDEKNSANISLWVTGKGKFFLLKVDGEHHILSVTNDEAYKEFAEHCPLDNVIGYADMYFPGLNKA